MVDGMRFDTSQISRLGADIGDVPRDSGKQLSQAVEITSRNIKDAWRDRLNGSATVPGGPSTITYDIDVTQSGIEAEIGPELGRRQATIVGILETGTPTTGARGFGLRALADNVEDFERGITKAVNDALDMNGL